MTIPIPMFRPPARRLLAMLALAVVAATALRAQQRSPRFTLPAVPYDYRAVDVPAGHPLEALRTGNAAPGGERVDAQATLGRVLFYDPLLSRNERRSCASCHRQDRAFADDRALSVGFRGKPTRRNSPGIVNLALHRGGFFWDQRVSWLEQMVLSPIEDPIEMGLDLHTLEVRLSAAPGYPELFAAAFGDATVTRGRVAAALATFLRAIVSLRSRYDEGLAAAGDADRDFANFTAAENRGKRLFFGGAGGREHSCAACHMQRGGSGFCGNAYVLGDAVFRPDGCRNNGVDSGRRDDDPGRAGVTGRLADRGAFRPPSLRNVEFTAPYMHDGRFATLEDVVRFYASGVRAHPQLDRLLAPAPGSSSWGGGAPEPPATDAVGPGTLAAPRRGMPMTSAEQRDLVAFLKTLSDPAVRTDPRFADPFAPAR